MTRNIGIIIPSYNEATNIPILIKKIFTALPQTIVIIVDDSKIEENKKLREFMKKNSKLYKDKVTLISRQKKLGRGSAVMDGLKEMLKNKPIQYFFEMDADLAHDPGDFKKFLQAVKENNVDVVSGSRYLQGSKITKWPLRRIIFSRIINIFINLLLGLKLSDYTNGFRLYNRNAVLFLTKLQLKEKGFIALSEIAYKLKRGKFKMMEVPINFTDRAHGRSSMGHRELLSALVGIIRIKILSMRFV